MFRTDATMLDVMSLIGVSIGWFVILCIIHSRGPDKIPARRTPRSTIIIAVCTLLISAVIATEVIAYQRTITLGRTVYLILSLAGLVSITLTDFLLLHARRLTKRFGPVWVKSLDLFYLALGIVGLVATINRSVVVDYRFEILDGVGLVFIACAFAVRLSKAVIEVFFDDWYRATR